MAAQIQVTALYRVSNPATPAEAALRFGSPVEIADAITAGTAPVGEYAQTLLFEQVTA